LALIVCIYCGIEKKETEFSLEHVIPQFLGGAYVSDKLKTNKVCKRCNNLLGLFVDASFAKNWFINNALVDSEFAFFDPDKVKALPLRCLGPCKFEFPDLEADSICELWLGPLGEQVYWIRPKDEKLYWYVGGNPISSKKEETRAYYIFSERSNKNLELSIKTFVESFSEYNIKKILCTKTDIRPEGIGFANPDEVDSRRIAFLMEIGSEERGVGYSHYMEFDFRFICKIALGVSYCLIGEDILTDDYFLELRKGLWYKKGEPFPEIFGNSGIFSNQDDVYKKLSGLKNSVTVSLIPVGDNIGLNLNISQKYNWTILCCKNKAVPEFVKSELGAGIVMILFKHLQRCIQVPMIRFLGHKTGAPLIPELNEIEDVMSKHEDYFRNL
jgi:hypothetical protein